MTAPAEAHADSTVAIPEAVIELDGVESLHLKGIALRVGAGERVAIIGRSGEGKTVLLRTILGLQRASRGHVRLLGRDVRSHEPVGGLGVAFQSPGLFDAWSCRQNLERALDIEIDDAELRALLGEVGLEHIPPDESPRTLSGGQQKRLSVLRAVTRATRLLVLDEPTSGLDPDSGDRLCDFLGRELRRSSAALLLVTHDYDLALRLCERIVLLTPGDLQEITVRGMDHQTSSETMREALRNSVRQKEHVATSRLTWGTAATTEEFFVQSLPLAAATMLPLGAMIVAQSTTLTFIDISAKIPGGVVAATFREMAPLVVGLLVSARIASRVAAEVAGMSYTAQLDSMRVLGISRLRLLVMPFVTAAALVFPLCIVIAAMAAIAGGTIIAATGWPGLTIGANRFLRLSLEAVTPLLAGSCLLKGILMGILVSGVSYAVASRPVASAGALGRTVTRATVASSIAVIVVDIIVSWSFFS